MSTINKAKEGFRKEIIFLRPIIEFKIRFYHRIQMSIKNNNKKTIKIRMEE